MSRRTIQGWVERKDRASGTVWVARYREGERKRSRTFPTEDLAWDFLYTRTRTRGRRTSVALTVSDAAHLFLERNRPDWELSTQRIYETAIATHILPALGDERLVDLTRRACQTFVDRLTLAPKYRAQVAQLLRRIIGEAVRDGLIEANVADDLAVPSARRTGTTVWTLDQARQVLAATVDAPRWHAIYQMLLTTGMRKGELEALDWGDVDLEGRTVTIRRTVVRPNQQRRLLGVTTKSRRPRRVTLTDGAVKILKSIGPSTGLVFPGRDGRPLHGSVLPKGHKRWCEKAGVPVIRMHDIRHTTATLLLEQGVHPKVVAEILGHSSIQITLDLYSHVSDELGRSAIDRMGDLLS